MYLVIILLLSSFDLKIFKEPNPLEIVREYVKRNRAEGLVFRCEDNYFKVNQGHLQTHTCGEKLWLAGQKT